MAPRKGESVQERSERCANNSEFWHVRGCKSRVLACLKNNPQYYEIVERHLHSLGAFGSGSSCPGYLVKKEETHAVPPGDEGAHCKIIPTAPCTGPQSVMAALPVDTDEYALWPAKDTTFGHVAPELYELAFRSAQPNVFTVGNWKLIIKRGAKKAPVPRCLEFLELQTGKHKNDTIPLAYRCRSRFVAYMQKLVIAWGAACTRSDHREGAQ